MTPMAWGSDAIAALLRRLDLDWVALNPGASYRGLHDSLVNYLGNATPRCCLRSTRSGGRHRPRLRQGRRAPDGGHPPHERRADARDHGDLRRVVRPGARADLGATGPMDAASAARGSTGSTPRRTRRPGPPLHQVGQPAGLVRRRGGDPARPIARTAPCGPAYVCLDAALQEAALTEPGSPDLARSSRDRRRRPRPEASDRGRDADRGAAAPHPAGRVSRRAGGTSASASPRRSGLGC